MSEQTHAYGDVAVMTELQASQPTTHKKPDCAAILRVLTLSTITSLHL